MCHVNPQGRSVPTSVNPQSAFGTPDSDLSRTLGFTGLSPDVHWPASSSKHEFRCSTGAALERHQGCSRPGQGDMIVPCSASGAGSDAASQARYLDGHDRAAWTEPHGRHGCYCWRDRAQGGVQQTRSAR